MCGSSGTVGLAKNTPPSNQNTTAEPHSIVNRFTEQPPARRAGFPASFRTSLLHTAHVEAQEAHHFHSATVVDWNVVLVHPAVELLDTTPPYPQTPFDARCQIHALEEGIPDGVPAGIGSPAF